MTKEHLIKLFTVSKPHQLSFRYREQGNRFKEAKLVLEQMIKEGTVKFVRGDMKEKIYELIKKAA